MSKSKYLYIKKWLIKPKPYPALLITKPYSTLQVNVMVGFVVAVVVVGCPNDFKPSAAEFALNSKAVFRCSFNFSIILVLVIHLIIVTDCISKVIC